ncbi:MAG: adenylate kinase, adenylate kinase [candidate division WWE3 bacterium GW2011_GWC1_41_7]|uniref:Adenylate kinase n=4 Tax=Katanobacteria TaxID=422282 RepID=A0A0G0ZJR5_UNCKA|nr:MAG: Adenylate kinase [candidate division WWE3 bacterium GW2011_GWB1_41_6]KKS21471.1 MAG: adenylate kinase, adenylate kinase [candidate division WWE3 bacterium GW2011_GWC1_41_7]KKS22276.1 MAG: Adenylate kinase [candidate division WWE3 bacterium GW2011_GWA1_41_8]OGC56615.1 MAG: hypothetical protein A2976_04370 [candidate division WWE3 bacterium RIFCSPLOWO2_01_FULL_41_9]
MKILLMGPPASGKGTVGQKLSDRLKLPLIQVGQVCRNIPENHPRYDEVKAEMDSGGLVPQDIVAELLEKRVKEPDCSNGYILDGWGRTMIDLHYFNPGFDQVLVLNLSLESAIKRITSRRVCSNCGEVYNIVYIPPKVEGICDVCGGSLIQRDDDSKEVVERRYKLQWEDAVNVVTYFRDKGIVLDIDAEVSPDEVFSSVLSALKL